MGLIPFIRPRVVVLGAALATATVALPEEASSPIPGTTAARIVERLLQRADANADRTGDPCLECRRLTVVEELDSRGGIRSRKTKEHTVVQCGSEQRVTLVRLNGEVPPEPARREETRREAGHRETFSPRRERPPKMLQSLGRDLLEQFNYRLAATEERDGRVAHLLMFEPAGTRSDGKIGDRILRRLRGRLWVDAVEFEPLRIEASLDQPVSVAGFLAVLDDFQIVVDRRRLESGDWVDERVEARVGGRKVLQRFRGRMEVRQEDFAVTAGASAAPGAP